MEIKKEEIDEALNKGAELSEEEYAKTFEKADKNANAFKKDRKYNGEKVSEATKHKRVQSNFYGFMYNAMNLLLQVQQEQSVMLSIIAGLTSEEELKAQALSMAKNEEELKKD